MYFFNQHSLESLSFLQAEAGLAASFSGSPPPPYCDYRYSAVPCPSDISDPGSFELQSFVNATHPLDDSKQTNISGPVDLSASPSHLSDTNNGISAPDHHKSSGLSPSINTVSPASAHAQAKADVGAACTDTETVRSFWFEWFNLAYYSILALLPLCRKCRADKNQTG
jgi:hypothetical protein